MINDNVTAFPGRAELPENPIDPGPRIAGYCDHGSIALDEHSRTVKCAKCAISLDPFDFLRHNARTLQRAWDAYRTVTSAAAEIAERVSRLKREEQNLKSRVKRAQASNGAVINTRG